jgi:hypothetical protein
LLKLLPDVYVYTDGYKGADAGNSPGFGVLLTALTTSGCLYGVQRNTGKAAGMLPTEEALGDTRAARAFVDLPEDLGSSAASLLLDEIGRGGCIDSSLQPLVFTLMALCPEDVSRVRIGQLGPAGVSTLRLLKDFFGLEFRLAPEVHDRAELEAAAGREAALAAKTRAEKGASDAEEEDDDEGGAGSDPDGITTRRHLKATKRSRQDMEDADGPSGMRRGKDPLAGAQPLAAQASGGKSMRSIMVSCVGVGFKNLAKKVT